MTLNLNEFVLAVVFGSLILVAVVSVISRFLHLRAELRLARSRMVCRICGSVFVSEHSGKLCQCPSCDKPNFRRGNGKLG
jgi:predicted Zn-ribbon and HTH transcriptional regulator